jgi:hypothetical protein
MPCGRILAGIAKSIGAVGLQRERAHRRRQDRQARRME